MKNKGSISLSGSVFIFLLIGLFATSFTILINDTNENYVDSGISNSNLSSDSLARFDNTIEINESFSDVFEGINDIGDGGGVLDVLGDGSIVLFKIFLKLPGAILNVISMGISTGSEMLKVLRVPSEIIYIGVIGFFIFVIFKIIEQVRRYPV